MVTTVFMILHSVTWAMETFNNPIVDGADPWVTKKGDRYYYCFSADNAIWVASSDTIQGALRAKPVKIWRPAESRPWSHELWAPELHFLAGHWYVYVAADDGNNENHRMYVLRSNTDSINSGFEFLGKIADSSDKWAIDGTVVDFRGQLYFIWSGWEGDTNVQQNLYIARMEGPTRITGKRVLISSPQYDWEKIRVDPALPLINEGPEALFNNGRLFLSYSASGSWTDSYCIGLLELTGDDPMNPDFWQKSRTPAFSGTRTVFSPGHASFVASPSGAEQWIIYHTAKQKGSGWSRDINMKQITWDIDGRPVFGYPESKGVAIPVPQ